MTAKDYQVGGDHYRKAMQPWDIIDEWGLNYYAGNVLKYLLRYPYKGGVEDLKKAKHYLEKLIEDYSISRPNYSVGTAQDWEDVDT